MKIKHIAILLSPIALLIGCLSESGPAAQDEKSDTLSSSIFASSSSELSISSSENEEESISSSEGSVTRKSSAKTRSSSSSQQDNYSEVSVSSSSTSDGTLKKCYFENSKDGTACLWSTEMSESDCTDEGGQLVTSCKTTGIVDECNHSSTQGSMTYVAYDETAAEFCAYMRTIDSLSSLTTSSSSVSSSNSDTQEAYGCYINDPDSGPYCVQTNIFSQSSCVSAQEGTVKTSCPTSGTVQTCDYSEGSDINKVYVYSEDGSNLCSSSLAKRAKMRLLP